MNCSPFRERILDLALDEALGGTGGDGRIDEAALRAHLGSCAACRNSLASRKALLTAIDRVLIDELREEPSPALAARVREAIEKEGSPRRGWWAGWVPAATVAALVLLVTFSMRGLLVPRHRDEPVRTVGASTPAPTEPTGPLEPSMRSIARADRMAPAEQDAGRPALQASRAQARPRPRPSSPSGASRRGERTPGFPEVIVPAGEMTAALHLSDATAVHPLFVAAPGAEESAGNAPFEPLSIEHLTIAPLVLQPLEEGAREQASPMTL